MRRNPHVMNPKVLWRSLHEHRELIWQLSKREVMGRYRGSILGLLWSFFNPIVMLLVYTFVFSVVFKARWPGGKENRAEFALVVFAGLIVFSLFAEMVNRAPSLILSNPNFVKKVVFPLEVLPYVALGTALFHALVSFAILLGANLFLGDSFHWTFLLFPVVLIPLVLLCLGISWFLSSLGVFVRDVGQVVNMAVQILLFMTPIFYPVSAVPISFRGYLEWNPLALIIEQMRGVVIHGHLPNWFGLMLCFMAGTLVAWFGLAWFQRTRNGFANVL